MNTRNGEPEKIVNINTAAEMLGLSPWTIRAWINQKRIRETLLIGSRRMIPLSEINRIIHEAKQAAREEDDRRTD